MWSTFSFTATPLGHESWNLGDGVQLEAVGEGDMHRDVVKEKRWTMLSIWDVDEQGTAIASSYLITAALRRLGETITEDLRRMKNRQQLNHVE